MNVAILPQAEVLRRETLTSSAPGALLPGPKLLRGPVVSDKPAENEYGRKPYENWYLALGEIIPNPAG